MAATSGRRNRFDGHQLFDSAQHDLINTRSFGFVLYLLGDVIIYTAMFAAFAVMHNHYAGGPTAQQVVHPLHAFGESVLIYTSAWLVGMAMRALAENQRAALMAWLGLALILGSFFIVFEIYDFHHAVAQGMTPQRSGYLSMYFLLIGVHGLHIFVGLLWLALMIVQIAVKGLTRTVVSRLVNFKLFWMFQAAIWVCMFTFVYLVGAL